jgi:hypothetical protein
MNDDARQQGQHQLSRSRGRKISQINQTVEQAIGNIFHEPKFDRPDR